MEGKANIEETQHAEFVRYEKPGRFDFEDYMAWYQGLREDQRDWLRAKAKWEGYTTAKVAMEWGCPK